MAEAKPYNASDERHVKGRRDDEKQERLRVEDAIRFVMSSRQGRNFVWWLLEASKLYETSFTGNSATFYNEGRRSMGLQVIAEIEGIVPLQFIEMWQEHLLEKKKIAEKDEALRIESVNKNGKEEY